VKNSAIKGFVSKNLHHRLGVVAMTVAVSLPLLLPVVSFGSEQPAENDDKQFTMIKGRGVPVCEAYLDLLQVSDKAHKPNSEQPVTDWSFSQR
jgi:hypothetical protein